MREGVRCSPGAKRRPRRSWCPRGEDSVEVVACEVRVCDEVARDLRHESPQLRPVEPALASAPNEGGGGFMDLHRYGRVQRSREGPGRGLIVMGASNEGGGAPSAPKDPSAKGGDPARRGGRWRRGRTSQALPSVRLRALPSVPPRDDGAHGAHIMPMAHIMPRKRSTPTLAAAPSRHQPNTPRPRWVSQLTIQRMANTAEIQAAAKPAARGSHP